MDDLPAATEAASYDLAEWDALVEGPTPDWALVAQMRCCRRADLEARVFDAAGVYFYLSETRQRWVRAELARQKWIAEKAREARRELWHGAWGGDNPRKGRDVVTSKRFSKDHVLRMTKRFRPGSQKPLAA